MLSLLIFGLFSTFCSSFKTSFFDVSTFPLVINPKTVPTSTTCPSFALISDNIPSAGAGTSKFTLSVSSSTIG